MVATTGSTASALVPRRGTTGLISARTASSRWPTNYWHPDQIIPTVEGCTILIEDINGDHDFGVWLNRAALDHGLQVFAEQCPNHMADAIAENDDSTTADCFLQCCVYGLVVYG